MATRVDSRRSVAAGGETLIRLTNETKRALETTEFWAMVAVIVGILIASAIVGQGDRSGNVNVDPFPASRAGLYVAIVAVGYMVSRGLAKSGSRDPYWSDGSDLPGIRDDADAGLARARD